jgi:pilus assembly protein CpaD
MNQILKLSRIAGALGLLCLSACGTSGLTNGPEAAFDSRARFPVSVEPRMMTLRLPYEGPQSLDRNTDAQLRRFAAEYLDHGSGALAVSAPRRFGNAPADVARRLTELGVPEDRIMSGNQDEPGVAGGIKLTYIRYVAQTPECGNWSTNLARTYDNTRAPNFGCTTQKNIAAMVADPRDLVSPQTVSSTDAQRRIEVLAKYRKGEPTVAQKTQEQSGAVSQVAGQQ